MMVGLLASVSVRRDEARGDERRAQERWREGSTGEDRDSVGRSEGSTATVEAACVCVRARM